MAENRGRARFVGTAIMLMAFWLLLTGRVTGVNLALGAIVATVLTFFNRELIFSHRELPPLTIHNTWVLVRYCALLVVEIIKANWIMARIVLSRRMDIDPGLVIFKPRLHSEVLQVLLGNSISLTPGTLTLDVKDEVFTVHIIDSAGAQALAEWKLEKLLETVREVS